MSDPKRLPEALQELADSPSVLDALMTARSKAHDAELLERARKVRELHGIDTPKLQVLHCPKCGSPMVDPGRELDTDYDSRL